MKKKLLIGVAVFIVIGGVFFLKQQPTVKQPVPAPVVSQEVRKRPIVTVVIADGENTATFSGIAATTAFEALSYATKEENIELKTKQYDFGVFVEQIGQQANTKEKAWIYFINGKSGTVAADTQAVSDGDTVEWKYIKPSGE